VQKFLPVLVLLTAGFVRAQSPPSAAAPPGSDPAAMVKWQMELLRQSVRDNNDETLRRAAAARQEQIARVQFMAKANHFVKLWGDFVYRLNEKQTFDAKLAKKISKAFHELEMSDGWPLRDTGK
jgi:hypothetical protein